jgi:hypothetical protein
MFRYAGCSVTLKSVDRRLFTRQRYVDSAIEAYRYNYLPAPEKIGSGPSDHGTALAGEHAVGEFFATFFTEIDR